MNFFGVGGAEIIAILVIMLVFAGPKRMIHWSYVLGTYVSKFRKMWSQTVDLVQKEFDEAGVDITLPKEPPTRQSLNRAITDAVKPMTDPLQQSLGEVKKDMDAFQELSDTLQDKKPVSSAGKVANTAAATGAVKLPAPKNTAKSEARKTQEKPAKGQAAGSPNLGSWSGDNIAADSKSGANGNAVGLGAWSETAPD
jgi:Sec-independent protein translocase protein TatA